MRCNKSVNTPRRFAGPNQAGPAWRCLPHLARRAAAFEVGVDAWLASLRPPPPPALDALTPFDAQE
jgi:hypothetical protein